MLTCWAVHKSKCHRVVTDAVDREVDRMAEEQAKGEAVLVARGVADMAAVGALEDDNDDWV